MKHLSLAALTIACFASDAGAQTTWYVDVGGTAPGSGTAADPYTQIQYAITRPTTLDNDILLVAPGTYVENVKDDAKRVNLVSSGGPLVTELRPLNINYATVYWENPSRIEGFTLTGNASSHINGGALNLANATAVRCIVRNNPGLGIYSFNADLRECTIADNGSGIFVEYFAGIVLRNTIVWDSFHSGSFPPLADYCAGILPPQSTGTGNLPGNPGFWEVFGLGYRLRPGSPCIDAGDPSSPLDPDGTRADIGAIPYDPGFAPAPVPYCSGKLNSQGCVPAIGSTGRASATPGVPFTITASNEVDNKAGLLFFGFGARSQPFQGGLHCIQLPTKRVGPQNSGGSGPCTGAFTFDMGGYIASGLHPGLVSGALVYCQWWSRDPLDSTGFGSGLSNALAVSIAP